MIPTFSSAVQIITNTNLTFSLAIRLGFQNENCKTEFLHLPLQPYLLCLSKWHHHPYSSKLYTGTHMCTLKHISHLYTPFHLPQHDPHHLFVSLHFSSVPLIPRILKTTMEHYFFTNTNWATWYPSKIFQWLPIFFPTQSQCLISAYRNLGDLSHLSAQIQIISPLSTFQLTEPHCPLKRRQWFPLLVPLNVQFLLS